MVSTIKSYLQFGITYCSIEVATAEGNEVYYSTLAKRKKNEFIDLQFEKFESVLEIGEKFSKNQHCHLIINTEKVLTKETVLESNDLNIVSKAFPSLKLEDFYYEILRTNSKCFVSICRKDEIQKIISSFESHNIQILNFHIGYPSINTIVPYIKERPILLPNMELEIQENELFSVQSKTNDGEIIVVDDTKVHAKFLISLSGLFNYLQSQQAVSINSSTEQTKLKKAYTEKNFFKKGILVGVFFLLAIMLTNLVFFTTYFKDAEVLRQEAIISKNQQQLLLSKRKSISEKEKIVNNLLKGGTSKASFYINRIVFNKPSTIQFTTTEYQPLNRTIRPDKKIDYAPSKIKISGQSTDKNEFSNWIEDLEKLDWIERVTIINYGGSSSGTNDFEISILLDNEPKK